MSMTRPRPSSPALRPTRLPGPPPRLLAHFRSCGPRLPSSPYHTPDSARTTRPGPPRRRPPPPRTLHPAAAGFARPPLLTNSPRRTSPRCSPGSPGPPMDGFSPGPHAPRLSGSLGPACLFISYDSDLLSLDTRAPALLFLRSSSRHVPLRAGPGAAPRTSAPLPWNSPSPRPSTGRPRGRAQDLGLSCYAPPRPALGPDPPADTPCSLLPPPAWLSRLVPSDAALQALRPLTTRNRECGAIGPPGTRPY